MRWTTLLLLVALCAAGAWAWLFGPFYVEAYMMREVAGTAALSWAAFDEAKGREALAVQLRRREIPDYLTPDACRFYEEAGGARTVDCAWTVDVYLPVVDQTRRLAFDVRESATRDGRLDE